MKRAFSISFDKGRMSNGAIQEWCHGTERCPLSSCSRRFSWNAEDPDCLITLTFFMSPFERFATGQVSSGNVLRGTSSRLSLLRNVRLVNAFQCGRVSIRHDIHAHFIYLLWDMRYIGCLPLFSLYLSAHFRVVMHSCTLCLDDFVIIQYTTEGRTSLSCSPRTNLGLCCCYTTPRKHRVTGSDNRQSGPLFEQAICLAPSGFLVAKKRRIV
jgi:hypothetical protein